MEIIMTAEQERNLDATLGIIKIAFDLLKIEEKDLKAMGMDREAQMINQSLKAISIATVWIVEEIDK
jgi:hypothetical protein